jgi:hypothetical protein
MKFWGVVIGCAFFLNAVALKNYFDNGFKMGGAGEHVKKLDALDLVIAFSR